MMITKTNALKVSAEQNLPVTKFVLCLQCAFMNSSVRTLHKAFPVKPPPHSHFPINPITYTATAVHFIVEQIDKD